MSSNRLLLKFAGRYPLWIVVTVLLSFSGALFNGVSTALIVPILLNFLGQEIDLRGTPPIIQSLLSPFEGVPEEYRLGVMTGSIILAIALKNVSTYASSLVSSSLTRALTRDLREEGLRVLLDVDLDSNFHFLAIDDRLNRPPHLCGFGQPVLDPSVSYLWG